MKDAKFRFSASILKRLGEELNPSPEQSILELVKNAYDANARECIIEMRSIETVGGEIMIQDDGDGMSSDDIIEGWLVLGRSTKIADKKTRIGRIPSGSKGLGRLAALRMGSKVALETIPRETPSVKYTLSIPWDEYDKVDLVDDVSLEIEKGKNQTDKKQGTDILLQNLKTSLSRLEVQKLARALILLADPFTDDPQSFKPELRSQDYTDLGKLVKERYFDDAEYHLVANLNTQGIASAEVVDFQGKIIFKADHDDISRNGTKYACPSIQFDLWAFILDKSTFSTRISRIGDVREWLSHFGGVHVYQNGLRVNPYGNPGNDWLEMNLARAKGPEEKPSTNNSIGKISIKDTDGVFVQKTDRTGFIENPSFLELVRFAKDALGWMARRRLSQAEERRAKEKKTLPTQTETAKFNLEKAIKKSSGKGKKKLTQAFEEYHRVQEKELKNLRQEVQLYRTLSTAGIMASTFAHESSGNPIKVITSSISTIERRGKQLLEKKYDTSLGRSVEVIKSSVGSLRVLSNVTLSLLDHDKRRMQHVEIHDEIEKIIKMYKPFLEVRKIEIKPDLVDGNPYLRTSKAAIEAILTNLINNSIYWLEESVAETPQILIRTRSNSDKIILSVLDNGPGIKSIKANEIWLPGQTTKKNGTGLGLTIVHDTLLDMGGNVEVIEKSELGGAEIKLNIPILGD